MREIIYKCACCGRMTKKVSQYVQMALGEDICLQCEVEREYEIDAMIDGRQRSFENEQER